MTTPAELAWQQEIVHALKTHQDFTVLADDDYDRSKALVPRVFLDFIEKTQSELLTRHSKSALVDGLEKALDRPDLHVPVPDDKKLRLPSVLDVWRNGYRLGDDIVHVAFWRPRDAVDPEMVEKYKANRFGVIQELHYDNQPGAEGNRLDLALFINGIPVVTVELKNQFTGQGTDNAEWQYRCDRSPNAPIFKFPHRAIVHFAVDRENARMATRLHGLATFFLPFNRGRDGGRGNPPLVTDHGEKSSTAYLWDDFVQTDGRPGVPPSRQIRAAWSRDRLLDILQSYATLEEPDLTDAQKQALSPLEKARKATLIFPRYHQYDAIDDMLGHTVQHGVGHPYLVKHSTGSGKSYTMAWLAHQLGALYRAGGKQKVYGTVIIVTDRLQLDSQLRDLVVSVSSYDNVHVAHTTEQLGNHLREKGSKIESSRIITTTLQKFFHLHKTGLGGSIQADVAIIIDEAHGSQGNTLQASMEEVLNMLSEASQANLSYYAFTATPRPMTREIFGIGEEGKKIPFHVYGMRQAREERFIVDVLRNMVFCAQTAELGTDNPDEEVAGGDLVSIAAEKQEMVEAKASFILRHFVKHRVAHNIDGSSPHSMDIAGRAMVLAPSVVAGVRYFRTLRRLIDEHGIEDGGGNPLRVLVAFTGDHDDPDKEKQPGVKAHQVSEARLNDDGAAGLAIAKKLRETHHILVAVNKFQTGFDEPRLMAMYVDKNLRDINAVQTLSRLNRPHKGMKGPDSSTLPRVVDFVNDPAEVIGSFVEEDEGCLGGYKFLTEQYIGDLYAALNAALDEDRLPQFLEIEAKYREARKKARSLDPDTAADSGAFAHFFAEQYASYKDLPADDRFAVRANLQRYLTYWPLACLVLTDAYPVNSELRQTRSDYRRMVKRFYDYVTYSDIAGDPKLAKLKSDDIHIEGGVALVELDNQVGLWEQYAYGDGTLPASEDAVNEPAPMEYTIARRKRVVPKKIIDLVNRYNATVGALTDDAQSQGDNVLSILERVANRVHNTPVLTAAAKSNEQDQYVNLYKLVWTEAVDELADGVEHDPAADETEKRVLKLVAKEPAAAFEEWAVDSYKTHNEEHAA